MVILILLIILAVVVTIVILNANKFKTYDEYELNFIEVENECAMSASKTDISKKAVLLPTFNIPDGMSISQYQDAQLKITVAYTEDGYPYYIFTWNEMTFYSSEKVKFTCKLRSYRDSFSIFSIDADGEIIVDHTEGKKILDKDGNVVKQF